MRKQEHEEAMVKIARVSFPPNFSKDRMVIGLAGISTRLIKNVLR